MAIRNAVSLICFFAFSQAALAASVSLKPAALQIVPKITFADKQMAENWADACPKLGQGMLVGKGIWGFGIFESFRCEESAGDKQTASSEWILEVKQNTDDDTLEFVLLRKTDLFTKGGVPQSKAVFPFSPEFVKALTDPRVAKLIGLKLIEDLPVQRLLTDAEIQAKSFKIDETFSQTEAPKEFLVVTMRYEEKVGFWIPRLISKMERTDTTKLPGEVLEYRKVGQAARYPKGEKLWLMSSQGRGASGKEIYREMDLELRRHGISILSMLDSLYDTIASGYVGIRYGFPQVKNHPLFEQMTMVGIFTEVRGGPLAGLRWYWDFAPEVKTEIGGREFSIRWSRAQLGWSFGMELPKQWIFNRIDVTPKIGMLDLDAKIPTALTVDEEGLPPEAVPYHLKNKMNYGLEAGVEYVVPKTLIRIWGSTDGAGLTGSKGAVSFLRAGADAYIDLYQFSNNMSSSLLFFFFGEKMTIQADEQQIGDSKIGAITFNQAFLGTGLTFSW
jgi:hypothetical protein